MSGQDNKYTSQQAFCAAIHCLIRSPPEASSVEGSPKQGLSRGLVLLQPLHALLTEQTGKQLCIDHFATHLVQYTQNLVKVSFENYWEGRTQHKAEYVVQHPSRKPVSLVKLLEILKAHGTTRFFGHSAGNLLMKVLPVLFLVSVHIARCLLSLPNMSCIAHACCT